MIVDNKGRDLLAPSGSRLFYVGPPKTGTTGVQVALSQVRSELEAFDVYYPGKSRHHRREIFAFLRRPDPAMEHPQGRTELRKRGVNQSEAIKIPPLQDWVDLIADVQRRNAARTLISHEEAAACSESQAREFVDSLGRDRTRIIITLRSPASMLPSRWSESVKTGLSQSFDAWLKSVYGENGLTKHGVLWSYLDMASFVERWATAAGPDNVIVIIPEPANRAFLGDAFAGILGVPTTLLQGRATDGHATNRSFSFAEAEVFRRFNELAYDPKKTSWTLFRDVIVSGAVQRVLAERTPGATEPRIAVPRWLADQATLDGERYAQSIDDLGVRVVGDLSNLHVYPPVSDDRPREDQDWYLDIAVEALAGALKGAGRTERALLNQLQEAQKRNERQRSTSPELEGRTTRPVTAQSKVVEVSTPPTARASGGTLVPLEPYGGWIASSFTTREIGRALLSRLVYKIRNRKSMPIERASSAKR
jgi:hypothetical protein